MNEEVQQEKSTPDKYSFSSFPLYEHKTPDFREKKGFEYIRYGEDNTYPDYLVYLFNRSTIHNAIVSGKTRFILGDGWRLNGLGVQDVTDEFLKRVNAIESIDDLTYKVILDRLIFGGYALRINWLGGKISSIYHQPFQSVRTNAQQSEYLVSKEWTRDQSTKATFKSSAKLPDDVQFYPPFNPNTKEGTQILYVTDYRPQIKIYPLPEYVAANAYIETDIEISNFHLNNIKTGFAAGTMVTFFNGKPAPEEKKELERDLKSKVSGTDNAGEILINFAEVNETKPEILPLRSNELDKQYEQLGRDTTQNIFIGHGVTSPLLFGVKTESQLGGRNELDIAWQLFSLNYVEPRRKQFEAEFNYLLRFTQVNGKLNLKPLKGLNVEFSEATIKEALGMDMVRQMLSEQLGIEIKAPATTQTPAPTQMSKEKINEFESILINKFSELGISSKDVEFATELSDDDKKVIDYLDGKKKIDVVKATKELKVDVASILKKLIEANIVQGTPVSENIVEIKDIQMPDDGVEVVTMWKYSGPKDDKNRSFCAKMLSLNKLYTREEIDNLNNDMKDYNTDVWKYRGGWYTVPNTDGLLHQPSCRHSWNQVLVKRKL